MKLFDKSKEIETIDIIYKNGKRYSIWLPKEVDIALKLLVEEDDDETIYNEDNLTCTFDIHGQAKWDNVNMIEE